LGDDAAWLRCSRLCVPAIAPQGVVRLTAKRISGGIRAALFLIRSTLARYRDKASVDAASIYIKA
jgi:hypothetical protein